MQWLCFCAVLYFTSVFADVVQVNEYSHEWTISNSTHSLSCWTPITTCDGCFVLGSVCLVYPSNDEYSHAPPVFHSPIWRGDAESPISFIQVWKDSKQHAFLLSPNCPVGYSAMGLIASSSNPPSYQDEIKCIADKYVEQMEKSDLDWFHLFDPMNKIELTLKITRWPFIAAVVNMWNPLSSPLVNHLNLRAACIHGTVVGGNCICDSGYMGTSCDQSSSCSSFAVSVSATKKACFGQNDGVVTFTITGGPGGTNYIYYKNPPLGEGYVNTGNMVVNNLQAGVHQYYVYNTVGSCNYSSSFTVAANPELKPNVVAANSVSCYGVSDGSVALSAIGGSPSYMANFNSLGWNTQMTYTDLAAGTYSYIIRDTALCEVSKTVTVGDKNKLDAIVVSTTPISCNSVNDGQVSLGASGGNPSSYQINFNNNGWGTTFSINGLAAATYPFTVKDGFGCTATSSVIVGGKTVVTAMVISKQAQTCVNTASGSATLGVSGGTGAGYSINFNGAGWSTQTFYDSLNPGTYNFQVRDSNLCEKSASVVINPAVELMLYESHENPACHGASTGYIQLAGGGGTGSYLYSKDGITFSSVLLFTSLAAGTHTMWVQDTNGCYKTTSITLSDPPEVAGSATATAQQQCGTPSGSIQATGQGGTAPYMFSKDGTNFQMSSSFTNLKAGIYTITIRDSKSCTGTFTVEVPTLQSVITANYTSKNLQCNGTSNGWIAVAAFNGVAPYTYSLNGGVPTTNSNFTGLAAGTYSIVVTADMCTFTISGVQISSPPEITTTQTVTHLKCNADTNTGALLISAIGGVPPLTYSLDGTNFTTSSAFNNLNSGTYKYYVKDSNGCKIQSTAVTIQRPNGPNVHTSITPQNCTNLGSLSFTISNIALPWQISFNGSAFAPSMNFNAKRGNYTWAVKYGDCTTVGFVFVPEVCTPCKSGFNGTGGDDCKDIDECATNKTECNPLAACSNTIGGYVCTCRTGYQGNGIECIDVDECLTLNGGCAFNAICTNTNGSRLCGECPPGTEGSGYTGCYTTCGNGTCDGVENCLNCYQDCRNVTCDVCGDKFCDKRIGENCTTCYEDCGPCATPQCSGNCTNNGACVNGLCVCYGSWSGPACEIPKSQPVTVSVTSYKPDIVMTAIVPVDESAPIALQKFVVSVIGLSELDADKKQLRYLSLSKLNFTFKNETRGKNRIFSYVGKLENGASVNVTIWQFGESSTSIKFANITQTFLENGVKLGVTVRSWPFQSLTHSLGIHMASIVDSQQSKVGNEKDERGSLRWLTVSTDSRLNLYGQFLDQAEVDLRVRAIQYTLNPDYTTTAIIPHFWAEAEMDPNFSVLLGGTDSSAEQNLKGKSGLDVKAIAIAVPVTICGVFLIAALACVAYPKAKLWWTVKHTPVYNRGKDGEEMDGVHIEKRNYI